MAKKKDFTGEVMKLIMSGCYGIAQLQENGEEGVYEGCAHSLYMWLDSGEAKVTLLEPTDPRNHKDAKTYAIEFTSFMGDYVVTVWETD